MFANYDDLFALQRELEKLIEDESDDFSQIKQLIRNLALDLGLHREFIQQFQHSQQQHNQ